MKIWILRHGIAAPAGQDGLDSERPLTAVGRKELNTVLKAARKLGIAPDVVLSSPLRRAIETAEIAAKVLKCRAATETSSLIPKASPDRAGKEIAKQGAAARVLVIGHEPNLGKLIGYLLGHKLAIDLKKAGLVAIEIGEPAGDAERSSSGTGVLKWILTPKIIEKVSR